jgi:hypothetical protein
MRRTTGRSRIAKARGERICYTEREKDRKILIYYLKNSLL